MLGYVTEKEALIWVQSESEANIQLRWKAQDGSAGGNCSYLSKKEEAYTARLVADHLEPGTSYEYQIVVGEQRKNGVFTTQALWRHRTDPPDFSFATGSCVYSNEKAYDRPGEPYGKGFALFPEIVKQQPSFMLWLGDNIYLREPDWTSRSGIFHRYSHFKSQKDLQELWGSMHHYAIWDDHDFGPNDADRSFVHKDLTLEAFQLFWGNQKYGIENKGGINSQFSHLDVDFFLLDNRSFRSPNARKTGEREILGEAQIEWLIEALVNSKASFKIIAVGGQFLSPAAVYENHATFAKERQKLLDLIEAEGIKNIVFLSGDRHKTELTKMELSNGNTLYDFTCSPLASKAYDTNDEGNVLRVEGTHVATQNFGTLSFSGPFQSRKLQIKTFDSAGTLLWEHVIEKE